MAELTSSTRVVKDPQIGSPLDRILQSASPWNWGRQYGRACNSFARNETRSVPVVSAGLAAANENAPGRITPRPKLLDAWPLAVIVVGLLASAAWSLGLLYGAYLLIEWAVR